MSGMSVVREMVITDFQYENCQAYPVPALPLQCAHPAVPGEPMLLIVAPGVLVPEFEIGTAVGQVVASQVPRLALTEPLITTPVILIPGFVVGNRALSTPMPNMIG